MKIYPSVLATWMILSADNALVSTKNIEVKVVTVRCCCCLLRCRAAFLL